MDLFTRSWFCLNLFFQEYDRNLDVYYHRRDQEIRNKMKRARKYELSLFVIR